MKIPNLQGSCFLEKRGTHVTNPRGTVPVLASLRRTPLFLGFRVRWCSSCVTDMPAMKALPAEDGDALYVLGVETEEPTFPAPSFPRNSGIVLPLVRGLGLEITSAHWVRAIPPSVFIDGRVVGRVRQIGALSPARTRDEIDRMGGRVSGMTTGERLVLEIVVGSACDSCNRARDTGARIAAAANERWQVHIVELEVLGALRPAPVFAVPTYLLNGKVISLGNPAEEWLMNRLEQAWENGK